MNILVVDDTRAVLLLLRKQLEHMGHTTVTAADGNEAIQRFVDASPDLILMDVCMPLVDGFEAARRIRAIETGAGWTPIIFLTGLADDGDLRQGIAAGGDDYLVKPVSSIVLESKIAAMQRIVQMRRTLLETTEKLDAANRELRRLSSIDGLTGIANRRCLDQSLSAEWSRGLREQQPLSVVMLDVDHFKQYNDRFGHQSGDECLRRVARALHESLHRPTDIVARYGGEEFSVLLPGADKDGALLVANRLRQNVEALGLEHPSSAASGVVTVSAGLATCVPLRELTPSELLGAADQMLYESKRSGRNRVTSAALSRMASGMTVTERLATLNMVH